ncbi:MAG: HAMP domain-containing sensor histidine kinase [Cyanobacteriota bacterium]|nr:HAMP domain-containing sensor histidine kinase [Cyanobacteriota bacterium]
MNRSASPRGVRPGLALSGRDWQVLLGYCLLGGLGAFLLAFLGFRQLLRPALMEAISERITTKVVLTEALLQQKPDAALPDEVRVVRAGGAGPAGSQPLRDSFDLMLQRDLKEHHQLVRQLRRENAPPLLPGLGGYWVELQSQQWLHVRSAYSTLPLFWPLVRTITLLGGGVLGLLLFLQQRLQRPLGELLRSLPQISLLDDAVPLVPVRGLAPLQTLGRGINQLIEQHNREAGERRDLLRHLAHDLRTPLTRLLLRTQKLQTSEDPSELLPGIANDLGQLRSLANQLSDLASQADPGLQFSPCSLDALCARLALSYPAGALRLAVPPLQVTLNQPLLLRSLVNLVDNALEYGKPPVLIGAQAKPRQGLSLWVDDCGPGLADYTAGAARLLPRSDDRQRQRHRGLGLAIVQRFCSDHGGRLVLQKAPSGGLRASLELPAELLS